MFEVILYGGLAGIAAGLSGFLNKTGWTRVGRIQDFDLMKFMKTIFFGAVIGGLAGYQGIDLASAEMMLSATGGLVLLERLVNGALKNF